MIVKLWFDHGNKTEHLDEASRNQQLIKSEGVIWHDSGCHASVQMKLQHRTLQKCQVPVSPKPLVPGKVSLKTETSSQVFMLHHRYRNMVLKKNSRHDCNAFTNWLSHFKVRHPSQQRETSAYNIGQRKHYRCHSLSQLNITIKYKWQQGIAFAKRKKLKIG